MPSLSNLAGSIIEPADLQIEFARSFVTHLESRRDGAFSVDRCHDLDVGGRSEAIVIRVRPELPQRPVHEFLEEEVLCVLVRADGVLPDLLSLRRDFPHVPHMNIVKKGFLSWICLFGEDPDEVRRRLTPQLFADRILWWFAKNAIGELHRSDQAPEPFLLGTSRPIYFATDALEAANRLVLGVFSAYAGTDHEVLVADRLTNIPLDLRGQPAALYPVSLPLQTCGVIHEEPETLQDLAELCSQANYDLLTELERVLLSEAFAKPEAVMTLLLLAIPKGRVGSDQIESVEYRAFRLQVLAPSGSSDVSPTRLAEQLGLGWVQNGRLVPAVGAHLTTTKAANVSVVLLEPKELTTFDQAAILNGCSERVRTKIVAIGVGALGSQVFASLARRGHGDWTLLDDDRLEPHNLARHLVFGKRYGFYKAEEVAGRANELFSGGPIAKPIVANLNHPGDLRDGIDAALSEASLVLDMSASTAVARKLAQDYRPAAPTMSLFLSPTGEALVLLYEGTDRSIPIDSIEMQYLRAVIATPELSGLLKRAAGELTYGAGCRDRSAIIPNELVSLHGAIGARAVQTVARSPKAHAVVWRCDPNSMEVHRTEVSLSPTLEIDFDNWGIVFDLGLKTKLEAMRTDRLPNETCGILLGQFDAVANRLYLVDALPAPPDSEERSDWCKRGVEGLEATVQRIRDLTGGEVDYVGEWHSHPDGASCVPSLRDLAQLQWICDRMHPAGLPGVILISCEGNSTSLLLSAPGRKTDHRCVG
jgi:hypothetical protein